MYRSRPQLRKASRPRRPREKKLLGVAPVLVGSDLVTEGEIIVWPKEAMAGNASHLGGPVPFC
jgi:hypothetical protein